MKTERRHELEVNQLALNLQRWGQQITPYSRLIFGLLALLVVGILAYQQIQANQAASVANGWQSYFEGVQSPNDDFGELAKKHAGEDVVAWATLAMADDNLAQGCEALFHNKAEAEKKLEAAAQQYDTLKSSSVETIAGRAMFGAARAKESLGQVDEAIKDYEALAKRYPKGPFLAQAEQRAADLKRPSTKEFYHWLASYTPPQVNTKGLPGIPGSGPSFDSSLDMPKSPISLDSLLSKPERSADDDKGNYRSDEDKPEE